MSTGRNFLRCWNGRENSPLEVVVINDTGGVKQASHLLKVRTMPDNVVPCFMLKQYHRTHQIFGLILMESLNLFPLSSFQKDCTGAFQDQHASFRPKIKSFGHAV
jgi:glyceraldehyde-3-phosphate dehydrogenase/erythrose-4-phosphate dehydrogenase